MGWESSFALSFFVHEGKGERKNDSLELVQPWRENYRSC
jgi:hypothetical protein